MPEADTHTDPDWSGGRAEDGFCPKCRVQHVTQIHLQAGCECPCADA